MSKMNIKGFVPIIVMMVAVFLIGLLFNCLNIVTVESKRPKIRFVLIDTSRLRYIHWVCDTPTTARSTLAKETTNLSTCMYGLTHVLFLYLSDFGQLVLQTVLVKLVISQSQVPFTRSGAYVVPLQTSVGQDNVLCLSQFMVCS